MARRKKAAHRRAKQNRFSMFLIAMVVVMIAIAVGVTSSELHKKVEEYAQVEAQLEAQIASEETRKAELEEYEKYTHTKKYIEDVAKDRLGLVYEGEIIFKEEE